MKHFGHNHPALGAILPGHNILGQISVTLTGRESDGAVWFGNHASYGLAMSDGSTITAQKWGSTPGGSEFGTAAAPSDFTSLGDGGTLHYEATSASGTASGAVQARYAIGTAPNVADGQAWTVDELITPLDGSASGTGLTFGYSIAGAGGGISIDPLLGVISGSPDAVNSGTATITATDQYGRQLQDTFTWGATLRAQATAANGLSYNWTVGQTGISEDMKGDFTLNGNTPQSWVIAGLPTALVDDGDGTFSGNLTAGVSSGSITATMTDEYGRQTVSTAAWAITAMATTNYSRNYSRLLTPAVIGIDLSTLPEAPPEDGPATYAAISLGTGVTLASATLNIDTADAGLVDGSYIVERTDNSGTRQLVLALTMVSYDAVIDGVGTATVSHGSDDPPTTQYSGNYNGGEYDGVGWGPFTKAAMDAVPDGQGLVITPGQPPVIDSGTEPLIPGNQVSPGRLAIFGYPAAQTAPTILVQLRNSTSALASPFTGQYTLVVGNTGPIFQRVTDGTTNDDSTGRTLATVPGAMVAGDWTLTDKAVGGTLTVGVVNPPSDGGSALTAIRYRLDGGAWVNLGGTTAGDYDITGLTDDQSYNVELQGVNAVDPTNGGPASDTKAETPTAGGGVLALTTHVALRSVTDDGTTPYTQFTFDNVTLPPGDYIIKLGCWIDRFTAFTMTCGVDGVDAGAAKVSSNVFNNVHSAIFHFTVASTLTNVDITLGGFPSSTDEGVANLVIEDAENFTATGATDTDSGSNKTSWATAVSVAAENAVTTMLMSSSPRRTPTWSGVDETNDNNTGFRACYEAKQDALVTPETRNVDVSMSANVTGCMCTMVVT